MPKSKSFFILEGGACLSIFSTLTMIALRIAKQEIAPELFNSIRIGLLWSFVSGILGIAIGAWIVAIRLQRVVTSSELTVKLQSQNDLEQEKIKIEESKRSAPEQTVAVVIPDLQKLEYIKFQDVDPQGIELRLASSARTLKVN